MPSNWKKGIIISWVVIGLALAYLIWGHWSMKAWGKRAVHSVVIGHDAQKQDLIQIGKQVFGPTWNPTDPTPGDWPPPDPPTFP
jgi:hypothetical protein